MYILALDLATNVGFAKGHPPDDLRRLSSGSFTTRTHRPLDDIVKDHMLLGFNLKKWMRDEFTFEDQIPDLIVYEAPMSPQRKYEAARSDASILLPWLFAQKVEETAYLRKISCVRVHPNTFRSVFIGASGFGNRKITKEIMIKRCVEYGYMDEKDKKDDNRADAIGIWHWAQVKFGKWQPPVAWMFGKMVAAR